MARVFGLSDADAWRRHANPWSVYTRIPVPLLLTVAIWSRAWIGWWSLVWGLVVLDPWITAFGVAVQMLGKLWFLDRMALLYDDVQN